jgi:hypothetical protein
MAVVNSFAKFYGASYPAVSDVASSAPTYGDAVNVLNGTLSSCTGYPAESEVLDGVVFGNSSEFTGTLDIDASANLPDVSKVRSGIAYGSTSQFVGVSQSPAVSSVLQGVGYGANGTEFVGTLQVSGPITPNYPSVEDVLLGVEFGNVGDVPMVGVFERADESIVKLDEAYGAYGNEYYGQYECPDDPPPCGESWLM